MVNHSLGNYLLDAGCSPSVATWTWVSKYLSQVNNHQKQEEDARDQDPTPPEVAAFVRRILGNHKRMRLGLLCEVAREQGLRWRDIPPAVRRMGYRVERLQEYQNVAFIFTDRTVA